MAGYGDNVLPEGASTNKPPCFNGENFTFWKMKMKIFMKASEFGLWNVIERGNYTITKIVNGERVPKEEDEYTENDRRISLLNDKAINILTCALSQKEYFRVSNLETAKDMWEALEIAHEGTSGVKESRLNTLKTEFELFRMNEGESIRDMEVRFSHLINHLTALGQRYSQRDQVRKVLSGLTKDWEAKVTAIEETKGESMTSVTALFGSLAEYESKLKYKREMKEKSKKGIALKADDSEDDGEEEDLEDDEEMGLLVRRFKKFYRKRGNKRFPPKRNFASTSRDPKEQITCYECKKPGHFRSECPQLNRKDKKEKEKRKDKFQKKKAYVSSIWGNSSESEEESDSNETANICLVAQEESETETEEVINAEPTYDELLNEYNDLRSELIRIAKELVTAKKKIKGMEEKLSKESVANVLTCDKCSNLEKKGLELTKTLEKFTKGSEMLNVILGNQRCISDKSGIGYDPCLDKGKGKKKQGGKSYLNYFRHSVHTSNPYAYCSYCNRKGHSTASCLHKKKGPHGTMKWVPKGTYVPKESQANQKGPKKIWVPKIA